MEEALFRIFRGLVDFDEGKFNAVRTFVVEFL